MPDHSDRVAKAASSIQTPKPRWRRPLSLFAVVAGDLGFAALLTVVAIRLDAIVWLGDLLDGAPSVASTLSSLLLFALALAPFAMWIFYRQFAASQRVLTQLAGIDTLTGLPNRLGLTGRLEEAISATYGSSSGVAILFVDLDRFKIVNDTFGHELGDALMVQVGTRLRDAVRPGDEVTRYGGDEFVVICSDIENARRATQIAQRIIDQISVPYETGNQTLNISCSIGISLTNTSGASAQDALRDADVAMYQAKAAGPGVYRIYDHILGKALTPSAIEARLRMAVEREEFRVYYQPVVDTMDGTIVATEALLRWEDPERGLIEPAAFLPLLEETGLIVPVGSWVLGEACRQADIWRRQFPDVPLEIKVNVAARQLGQADFGDFVAETLQRFQLNPESLVLEITESALMDDVSSAWSMLRSIKATGVRLALDDFGTGFSSLSYIRQFSLDMLKIDRSFVTGITVEPDDHAIVAHVIGLASALHMVTVAEGVEESGQLRALQLLKCDRSQGFWFSPPVPPAAIEAMLADPTLAERWSRVSEPVVVPPSDPPRRGIPSPLGSPDEPGLADAMVHVLDQARTSALPDLTGPVEPVDTPPPLPELTTRTPPVDSSIMSHLTGSTPSHALAPRVHARLNVPPSPQRSSRSGPTSDGRSIVAMPPLAPRHGTGSESRPLTIPKRLPKLVEFSPPIPGDVRD